MTNTNKKSMKKKLISAIAMLTVSAVTLSTATYAWFTMNKTVEVTGMEVKTKVGGNLLICTTNNDSDYSANTLIQTRRALLEPSSTINGTTGSFFYTTDAKADGSKDNAYSGSGAINYVAYNEAKDVKNATAGKPKYDDKFNLAYGQGTGSGTFTSSDIAMTGSGTGAAYGYIDYTFYLKATADKNDQKVVMTQCDLDYNGDQALNQSGTVGVNIDRAWRVAVFAQDISGTKPGTGRIDTDVAGSADNLKSILRISGAQYFSGTAVSAIDAKADPNDKIDDAAIIDGDIDAGNTRYYKVTVRLWLEGEDTTCNSKTYATLTDAYSLDLKFDLVDKTDTAGVTSISTNTFDADKTPTQTGNQYDGE